MRVRQLLDDPALALDIRVRVNVERSVRWVHTIEVPDPGRFLRGGEVVLTAGVWRAGGVTSARFVGDLREADVAAVGFGLVPPETEAPAEFVEAADDHGLTCFVVPVTVPFVQVVEAFVSAKRVEWERPLRRHLDQHEAIVSALRSQRGVGPVLRVLGRQLGMPVAVRAAGTTVGREPEPSHPLPLIGEGLANAELLLPYPLSELDVELQAAVAGAMPFLGLELERERALRATELRYAGELFEWIHGGTTSPAALATRLHSLGVRTDGPLAAVVLRSSDTEADVARLSTQLGAGALVVERNREVTALCPVSGTADALARRLHEALDRTAEGGYSHLGVGRPGPVAELRLSLLQAGHAVDALASRGSSGWLTYQQLSSPTLLLSAQDPEVLAATADAVLGGVVANDDRRGGELLPSLAVFLEHGGRWQDAARVLHVHINTLRHRMKRVEELTGLSLANTQDRVDLFLALRALRRR